MGDTLRYAGFWLRVGASIIDTLLLALLLAPLLYLFTSGDYFYTSEVDNPLQLLAQVDWAYLLINEGLPLLVVVFFWVRFEGTPGKRLLNCYVVDARSLQALTPAQALLRYLGYFVSVFSLGLGFLWIAFDKRKRGFHDMIAGSVVVIRNGAEGEAGEEQKSLQQLMKEAS